MTASTTAVSTATKHKGRKLSGPGVTSMTFDLTLAAGDLELNDIMEVGYVPGNVTVLGFMVTVLKASSR